MKLVELLLLFQIDCTALWYLSGYSLATAVDLAIAADRLHPQYTNHEKRTFTPVEGASGMVDLSQDDVIPVVLESPIKGLSVSKPPVDGSGVKDPSIKGVCAAEQIAEGTCFQGSSIGGAGVSESQGDENSNQTSNGRDRSDVPKKDLPIDENPGIHIIIGICQTVGHF